MLAEGRQGRPRRNREEQAAMNSLIVLDFVEMLFKA